MSAPVISVRALVKTFPPRRPGGSPLPVLRDVKMEVADHEFLCILGPSGCGKSTFLNILAGLDSDFEGDITIGAERLAGGRPPVRVSYVFQEARLLPWLTAEKNIDFVLDTCKVPRGAWAELKDRYFALVGLEAFRRYHPHQLSGGMRQRLALVRALCVEPKILLMDEPFSGLDELTARRLRLDLLRIWRETRKTIIFVTHNAYEASFLADRILVMCEGVVRKEIPVQIPRPRDYDDPQVFEVNRRVVRDFLSLAAGERDDAEGPAPAAPGDDGLVDEAAVSFGGKSRSA